MQTLSAKLAQIKEDNLYRTRQVVKVLSGNRVCVDGQSAISFCSNDYLALSKDDRVIAAMRAAALSHGVGSGGSPLLNGFHPLHQAFERDFSRFMGYERSLLVGSGYLANVGVLKALFSRRAVLCADKYIHASMIDGIELSGAKLYRYAHLNMSHLDRLLEKHQPDAVITEGVFSMPGTVVPLNDMVGKLKKSQTKLILDDAHGIGVLGQGGRGTLAHCSVPPEDIDCHIAPLGKAFAAMGCVVSGRHELIEYLLQQMRPYMYSTALPPSICAALLSILPLVSQANKLRLRLSEIIAFFKKTAAYYQLKFFADSQTPIQSIVINDNAQTMRIKSQLLSQGFLVSCIRPPTVPTGQALIRFSLNVLHTQKHIELVLKALAEMIYASK